MSHKLPLVRVNAAHNAKVTGISAAGAVYDPTPYDAPVAPVAPDPDPYALYPVTGVYSPREQHDADSALITVGKVWAASGMPSLGFQRFIEINGALCRHIDWLKAQLAALRGEE